MGIVPEVSVSSGFAPSKKSCGKVLILSFSARDGCIGRKPRSEKNDEMHNSQRLFMIFSPFFTRFGRERPVEKPRWAVFSLVFALEIAGETAVFAKGTDLARAAGGEEGKSGEEGVFRSFPVRIVPGGVHAGATSPIGRVCSVEDDEGELGKKSACFTQ